MILFFFTNEKAAKLKNHPGNNRTKEPFCLVFFSFLFLNPTQLNSTLSIRAQTQQYLVQSSSPLSMPASGIRVLMTHGVAGALSGVCHTYQWRCRVRVCLYRIRPFLFCRHDIALYSLWMEQVAMGDKRCQLGISFTRRRAQPWVCLSSLACMACRVILSLQLTYPFHPLSFSQNKNWKLVCYIS